MTAMMSDTMPAPSSAAARGKMSLPLDVAVPISADASQLFLFQQRAKWSPGGPPPPGGAH